MSLVRAFSKSDESIIVMHPNPRLRKEGESEAEFCDRICTRDAARVPQTYGGLPFVDVDHETLPPRVTTDREGNEYVLRHAWKLSGNQIILDQKMAEVPFDGVAAAAKLVARGFLALFLFLSLFATATFSDDAKYIPNETQSLRLQLKQKDVQIAQQNLFFAQQQFKSTLQGLNDEAEKVRVENKWPDEIRMNQDSLVFAKIKDKK